MSKIKKTPEGNEATEQCPICDRWNAPGACDHCEHYFGADWDWEIINSDRMQEFDRAWGPFTCLVQDLKKPVDAARDELKELGVLNDQRKNILRCASGDESASFVLRELLVFEEGSKVATEGMVSGEGETLYLDSPSDFTSIMDDIKKLTELIKKIEAEQKD